MTLKYTLPSGFMPLLSQSSILSVLRSSISPTAYVALKAVRCACKLRFHELCSTSDSILRPVRVMVRLVLNVATKFLPLVAPDYGYYERILRKYNARLCGIYFDTWQCLISQRKLITYSNQFKSVTLNIQRH